MKRHFHTFHLVCIVRYFLKTFLKAFEYILVAIGAFFYISLSLCRMENFFFYLKHVLKAFEYY